jgi:hypothetical protein
VLQCFVGDPNWRRYLGNSGTVWLFESSAEDRIEVEVVLSIAVVDVGGLLVGP